MKILINEKLSEHKYKTPEGYLICVDSVLARTGKQTYRRNEVFGDSDDDSEIEIDRPAKEVFSDATLASFENKPITVEHPDEDVNAENYKDYAVGFVRDVHQGVDNGMDVIVGTLVITDAKTIEEIENGEHTDLSCGYDCDIIDEKNPVQRNIRGNHVALCAQGRAGNARIVDTAVKDMRLPPKWKKDIQRILHARSTFTKRDIDVSEIVNEIERYMKIDGHPLTLERERINGWNKMGDGMMRKDYTFGIRGYDDKILISLYADPDTWKVTEVNGYFKDSMGDEEMKDTMSKEEAIRVIRRYILPDKKYTHESYDGITYLTPEGAKKISEVAKSGGLNKKDLERIDPVLFGPSGYYTLVDEEIENEKIFMISYSDPLTKAEKHVTIKALNEEDAQNKASKLFMENLKVVEQLDSLDDCMTKAVDEDNVVEDGNSFNYKGILVIKTPYGWKFTLNGKTYEVATDEEAKEEIDESVKDSDMKDSEFNDGGIIPYKDSKVKDGDIDFLKRGPNVKTHIWNKHKKSANELYDLAKRYGIKIEPMFGNGYKQSDYDDIWATTKTSNVKNLFEFFTKLNNYFTVEKLKQYYEYQTKSKVDSIEDDKNRYRQLAQEINQKFAGRLKEKLGFNEDGVTSKRLYNDKPLVKEIVNFIKSKGHKVEWNDIGDDGTFYIIDSMKLDKIFNNDALIAPPENVLREVENQLKRAGFKIESKKKHFGGEGIHYQVRLPGKYTEKDLRKYADILHKIMEYADKQGCPSTWNVGLGYDDSITAGLDVREKYVKDSKVKDGAFTSRLIADLKRMYPDAKMEVKSSGNYSDIFLISDKPLSKQPLMSHLKKNKFLIEGVNYIGATRWEDDTEIEVAFEKNKITVTVIE